jgi:hypothetical protein
MSISTFSRNPKTIAPSALSASSVKAQRLFKGWTLKRMIGWNDGWNQEGNLWVGVDDREALLLLKSLNYSRKVTVEMDGEDFPRWKSTIRKEFFRAFIFIEVNSSNFSLRVLSACQTISETEFF